MEQGWKHQTSVYCHEKHLKIVQNLRFSLPKWHDLLRRVHFSRILFGHVKTFY